MGRVFISYARRDIDYVRKLMVALDETGISAWFDARIAVGDPWEPRLEGEIRNCLALVVVMTRESEHSQWVQAEIDLAEEMRKPILPVLLRDECFARLAGLNYADVRGGALPGAAFFVALVRLMSGPALSEDGPAVAKAQVLVERRLALAQAYRSDLTRPILATGDVPAGIRFPSLEEGYVNPRFRSATAEAAEELTEEGWWSGVPAREDAVGFLADYLTAPHATDAPVLVLGQPGSGKSVLARVLAARLPPSAFLVVKVALREVPAEADVQTQTEYSIRSTTGETVAWPDLVRSAGDALPTIILDGFDELLQATGASQSDYLERLASFQRREAEQQRPVAVIVTSRTAVADRARSVSGTVAVRLEPFAEDEIGQWLEHWNRANAEALTSRGLSPLPIDRVLEHPQLASQPLLLLMLALYDADSNALQRDARSLAETELYERLLTGFAQREISKSDPSLSPEALGRSVEFELTRLSAVAFAMFNRNRQWATQAELDQDLPALLDDRSQPATTGMRSPLTAGEVVLGRFYFVHEAQAVRDGARLRTYEFLHATFGEYLVARLVSHELTELAEAAQVHATRGRVAPIDDAFLYALLSSCALSTRTTVLQFLHAQLRDRPVHERELLKEHLLRLFHSALFPRTSHAYDNYRPTVSTVPARHAVWAANLALLAVLVGEEVTAQQLFPNSHDGVSWWRQMALLWRSQLTAEGWNGLVHSLDVLREWNGDQRVIRIRLAATEPQVKPIDLQWSYSVAARDAERRGGMARWRHYSLEDLRRHNGFLCDRTEDTVMHAVEPFAASLDATIGTIHGLPDGTAVTPAHALLAVLLAEDDAVVDAYDTCLHIALDGFLDSASADTIAINRYRSVLFRQLAADVERLPPAWISEAISRIAAAGLLTETLDNVRNETETRTARTIDRRS
jgi:hypothetical protein